MSWFLVALAILFVPGLAALLLCRHGAIAGRIGAGGAVAGCIIGLVPAIRVLLLSETLTFRAAWPMPGASFFLEIDPLSAFFLLPILLLSGLAAIYGLAYLQTWKDRKWLGIPWFFYNLLVIGMALVVTARNGFLFLMAWELMALSSFFLVTFENENPEVQKAGWIYFVATHIGTAFVIVFFLLLGRHAGSLDFDQFGALKNLPPDVAAAAFLLAWVGFGTKAGFVPMHVWLPEAHPAAPSHVSAVMSGVMIKTGIYGLMRALMLLPPPPAWWGWCLILSGLLSGLFGVLYAIAQHDIKRLLAYHSVENIGIIALGMGCGLLGLTYQQPVVAALGMTGALLHVLNHALFKGLLFLGAGAVAHATGTRDIEHLGGLARRMPWTAVLFLVGCVAIAGLPPLNGFVSEFLIYFASFSAIAGAQQPAWPLVAVIAGLLLIGGLAAACFAKAFGIIFLGEPRSEHAAHAHEPGPAMRFPMLALATGCVLVGICSVPCVKSLQPVVTNLLRIPPTDVASALDQSTAALGIVVACSICLGMILGLLLVFRRRLLRGRIAPPVPTWDCGYVAPSPRMQYTASSFVQPFTDFFQFVLRTRGELEPPRGYFPGKSRFSSETPDRFRQRIFSVGYARIQWMLSKLHWLQHGKLHLYVLYIALTLLTLLVWHFWRHE